MAWQDIIITVGNAVLAISLLPSVFGNDKPALSTSIATVVVLTSFALVYFSLQLWLGSAITSMVALLWLILAIQVALRKSKK